MCAKMLSFECFDPSPHMTDAGAAAYRRILTRSGLRNPSQSIGQARFDLSTRQDDIDEPDELDEVL